MSISSIKLFNPVGIQTLYIFKYIKLVTMLNNKVEQML